MNVRNMILTMTVCLVITLPLAGCGSPEQKEANYIKRGNSLFDKGEFEKARVEYKNAARLKPADAEPFYRLGLVDEEEGNLRNAFAGFTAAEQQNSHFHPATLKIAQYHMAAEQYAETRRRIDAVLSEAPDDAEAHALNAALLLREKDFDSSEKEARVALAKEPTNITACSALTGLYSAKKDWAKAIDAINDGIAHNPKNLGLLILRVMVYEQMNDLPKIAESYQAIFKLNPDDTKFRVDLATTYIKANKLDEAEATLREGVAALPDNGDMKHKLVLFLNEHRGPEVAEKEIKDLMQANPKNDDVYFWLADLYITRGDTDKAIALLDQIVERGQFDQPALNARTMLARINVTQGNKELADKLVASVLEKAPDNRAALLLRAGSELESGYYQSAVSDLRTIVRTAPNDQNALQMLGEALLLQGHLDLAIDTMKKLSDLNPTNTAVRVRLAQIVNMNGDTKQAMDLITQVTKADPAYPVGWETAARISIGAKKWLPAEEAIHELDKIKGQHLTATFLEGQVLSANGKNDDALTKFTEVVSADPTTPLAEHALKALVDTYQKLGRVEAAETYLESLKTDNPEVSTLLGKCYAVTNKPDESAAAFDKAIAKNAPFQEPYLDRASLFLKEHKTEQALEVLKKGTLVAPADFRAPLAAASLLGDAGKYQEAIALYDDLLARNPGLDVAANNLAEIIADYLPGDSAALEKARQTAEHFSGSTNPLLLDTLAWVYFRQGNLPQAQTLMERALSQGGNIPPQVHYHYGEILEKSGKHDQAKAEFKQAVTDGAEYPGLEEAKKMLK